MNDLLQEVIHQNCLLEEVLGEKLILSFKIMSRLKNIFYELSHYINKKSHYHLATTKFLFESIKSIFFKDMRQ